MSGTDPTPYRSSRVLLAGAVWLATAITFAASGAPQHLRPPVPQLIVLVLTGLLLLATFRLPGLFAWAFTIDSRWLVALHLSRFVGIYFLVLYARGELPGAFAVAAGWGDILVAILGLFILISGPPTLKGRWPFYVIWNAIGLVDILMVVARAALVGIADPQSMRVLLKLPLNPLLTFLVPLIIASHIVLFARLTRIRKADAVRANAA